MEADVDSRLPIGEFLRSNLPSMMAAAQAEDGSVRSVTVLESPDSAIAREMSEVLKRWKFAIQKRPIS